MVYAVYQARDQLFPEDGKDAHQTSQVHLGFALFHSILSIRLLDNG